MKRFNFFLLLFLGFGSFLIAQEMPVEPVPVQVASMKCGAPPSLTFPTFIGSASTPSYACTSKTGKTEKEALAHLLSTHLARLSCNDVDCNPSDLTCKVKYDFVTKKLKTKHSATQWCFRGSVQILWHCPDCHKKVNNPNNEYSFSFSEIENPFDNHTEANLHKIFPNPSTGLVNLEVTTAKDHGEVVIKVFDLSGKMVNQENFQADPDSKFLAQIDLSELNSGVYLVSTFVDNQLIGTSKVTVK